MTGRMWSVVGESGEFIIEGFEQEFGILIRRYVDSALQYSGHQLPYDLEDAIGKEIIECYASQDVPVELLDQFCLSAYLLLFDGILSECSSWSRVDNLFREMLRARIDRSKNPNLPGIWDQINSLLEEERKGG